MTSAPAALITGGAARLGAAMAQALGARGYRVALHYRSSHAAAQATADAVVEAGGEAVLVQADLDDDTAIATLMGEACAALGCAPSLLINNASTFLPDSAQDFDRSGWDAHMRANLYAPCVLARDFAAALEPGQRGLVVNLIDQRVWKLNPTFFTYTLSKSALWTATRTLAQALSPRVRVNAIGPGPTLRSVHQSAEEFAAEAASTLTGEGASPEEIVRALLYLLDASSVTGQMIACDGGQHLLWQTPDLMPPTT
jgi:NAD(P)-dependent dehydrogenase (short-subunit alcohol dehydrogenase family)